MEDPESVIADSDELLEELRLPRLEQAEKLRPLKLETNGMSARPSRLDMLPEASRSDLAPDDEGTDFVWKQLWNRWSSPVDSVESRHVELSKPAASQPSATSAPAVIAEPIKLIHPFRPAQLHRMKRLFSLRAARFRLPHR